jgi:hypothetical protein
MRTGHRRSRVANHIGDALVTQLKGNGRGASSRATLRADRGGACGVRVTSDLEGAAGALRDLAALDSIDQATARRRAATSRHSRSGLAGAGRSIGCMRMACIRKTCKHSGDCNEY